MTAPTARRRRTDRWNADTVSQLVAAGVGAVSLTWVLSARVLPIGRVAEAALFGMVTFVVLYGVCVASSDSWFAARDRVAAALFTIAGLLLFAALVAVVSFTAVRGYQAVLHINFWTETTATTGPADPLTKGGVLAALVGTLEQVGIAALVSVPLGLATAVYLNEVGGRLARTVRTVIDAMSAVPGIVAGLFVFAVAVLTLGYSRSGLAAAIALAIEMLPVVTRTGEVVLRLVPEPLREAAYALGSTQWQTVRKVVLPTARTGLVTAVLLGVARVIGETAPVLLTSGFTAELNADPAHGPQVSLPLFIFTEVRFPLDHAISRAFGAALVLLTVVIVLFTAARLLGRKKLS
ncbi:MAG: phosphate transporter, inner rane subunit PstA [Frankiales bacterium]|nr:phosphate transporter, inner rane subunit PstA [Frankiales bacterium]